LAIAEKIKAEYARRKTEGGRQKAESHVSAQPGASPNRPVFSLPPSAFRLLALAFCLVFVAACRQDMQDQPKYLAYRESTFFKDNSSMRHPPEGTVARGFLKADTQFYTGKMPAGQGGAAATGQAGGTTGSKEAPDVTTFPFQITDEVMSRGKERFEIYCSACHGLTGQGDGMIVRRGYRKPPTFTDQRLLASPVGHYFDVITNGWGAMPSYAPQVPVHDRWAIIAYIRALQRAEVGYTGNASTGNANAGGNANGNANAAPAPATNRAQNPAGGQR
jgi:mono/diheme cytochrome c family protein